MKINVLNKNEHALKECLTGKKRIIAYGAGSLSVDIKKMLKQYGYELDYAIVDKSYYNQSLSHEQYGGGTTVTLLEKLNPPYSPETDIIIWAIASPEKLHSCIKDEQMAIDVYLIWNMYDFWDDKNYPAIHQKEFAEALNILYDDHSKKVFCSYIEAQAGNVKNDILYSTNGTYFNDLTIVHREGVFVDCGAYDGASAIDYMNFIGKECKVYAFEPDQHNYQNMVNKMENKTDFICLNMGCWSSNKLLSFTSNGDMSSGLHENGNDTVKVTTIDSVIGNDKVAFIKMDVEGAELEALKGARKVIERDMPILAISAYHKQEDLITLIPYMNQLHNKNEKYHLFLRHHGVVQTELVIYAIPYRYKK